MSNENLPAGAFLTTLNGRRCTAVPRSSPAAASQSVGAATASAAQQQQQQPQATGAGNAEASTEETSISSPEPAERTAQAQTEVQAEAEAQAEAQAQAEASRASRSAQRAEQATAAVDPVLAAAQADAETGGSVVQQGAEEVQVTAQDSPQPTETVAQQDAASSQPPPPPPPPPSRLPPPPPIIDTALGSDDRGGGVAPNQDVVLNQEENAPIQAFTANENETESTSSPSLLAQTPAPAPASAAESSQTDNNLVPATPAVVAGGNQQPPVVAAATAAPGADQNVAAQGDAEAADGGDAGANGALIQTIGLNNAGTAGADNAATTVPNAQVEDGANGGGGIVGAPTAVVAGSVIGGLAVVSLVAFILWFWRKRVLRRRRSTLLTPLSVGPNFGRGRDGTEKSYFIDRASVGPTPKSSKLKAAVGANFKKMLSKRRDGSVSVNMNRGNSQFMDSVAGQHSRESSNASARVTNEKGAVTGKDRFMDWWSRLTSDASFNWKTRTNDAQVNADPFAGTRDMKEKTNAMGGGGSGQPGQPDFLTLLGMDDREVQREKERRQQAHRAKGSASSTDHFLGGLNLNFDSANPFSDANALPHDSAKPPPLVVSQANNPFSDDKAIRSGSKPPTTYVADVRRSRGQSVGGVNGNGGGISNAALSPRVDSMYRESVASVDPFGSRRNKFRSDPFDLERPELLGGRQAVTSSNMSTAGSSAPRFSNNTADRVSGLPSRPGRAHQRSESFTSKYSSGISLGDWSDPGPDVGPAGRRWDSPTEGWRPGERPRGSGSSQSIVGKAL